MGRACYCETNDLKPNVKERNNHNPKGEGVQFRLVTMMLIGRGNVASIGVTNLGLPKD